MNLALKINRLTVINLLTMVTVFSVIMFLSYKTPYINDDWHFKFVWLEMRPTENDRLMTTFNDYVISLKNYYLYSGGRVFCHLLAFIFVNANKWVFNIFNAIVFVAVGRLMYKLVLISSGGDRAN